LNINNDLMYDTMTGTNNTIIGSYPMALCSSIMLTVHYRTLLWVDVLKCN